MQPTGGCTGEDSGCHGDISEVATHRHRQVVQARATVMRRVIRHGAGRQHDFHPGVRRAFAEQVARNVARRQTECTQQRQHDVREVLTHAAPQVERHRRGRPSAGDANLIRNGPSAPVVRKLSLFQGRCGRRTDLACRGAHGVIRRGQRGELEERPVGVVGVMRAYLLPAFDAEDGLEVHRVLDTRALDMTDAVSPAVVFPADPAGAVDATHVERPRLQHLIVVAVGRDHHQPLLEVVHRG